MSEKSLDTPRISIIVPAKNEADGLAAILPRLKNLFADAEIIVVDDGSTDGSSTICEEQRVRRIGHSYSMGNGAAVKTGARAAKGEILVFMDADGQHKPEDVPALLNALSDSYDMIVGARGGESQANFGRWYANSIYNRLASWIVNHKISDLTSGFRAVRAGKFREFLHLLPNGFSYPTTITMSFFRAGYPVGYVPIQAKQRSGKSHINPLRDGIRFLLIIFKVGTLYSPLKIFFPISVLFFLAGLSYYIYTFATIERFTNMSALLFTTSLLVFLIGLVSEQITNLMYSHRNG
jgi:glycosyltransferase involved in cell wall biosynthesis